MYEASAKEEYALWAIRLQDKQDELFYDPEGGGYFVSAPDEHILIRMKDAQASPWCLITLLVFCPHYVYGFQDGAEPSAASVTLSNLQRLAHFAEDRHAAYTEKAQSIVSSNGQLLTKAPHALASMVAAALMAGRGYRQVRLTRLPLGCRMYC